MKGFTRQDRWFSLCGLNCGLCPMRLGGHCPGCGGGEGNQSCTVARCSLVHGGVAYCFQCQKFPCDKYDGADAYDSFITHQRQFADIAKARAMGASAYGEEQARRAQLLEVLLEKHNDGRRKGFFILAANLLPIQDLEGALAAAAEESDGGASAQEVAAHLADRLREAAARAGVELRLRKAAAG
ncbi:MAG TPA: DUF3795 domain-containing protein [Candidatus Limnocylindria bacterium]|nr:DUF3795 domain-containing protein [Candidatus Limnocylindria bacterium]